MAGALNELCLGKESDLTGFEGQLLQLMNFFDISDEKIHSLLVCVPN